MFVRLKMNCDVCCVVCWFSYLFRLSVRPGKEFQGRRLNVSMARRKTVPGFMRGGMAMRGGPNMMDRGGTALLHRTHTHRERTLV